MVRCRARWRRQAGRQAGRPLGLKRAMQYGMHGGFIPAGPARTEGVPGVRCRHQVKARLEVLGLAADLARRGLRRQRPPQHAWRSAARRRWVQILGGRGVYPGVVGAAGRGRARLGGAEAGQTWEREPLAAHHAWSLAVRSSPSRAQRPPAPTTPQRPPQAAAFPRSLWLCPGLRTHGGRSVSPLCARCTAAGRAEA